MLNELVFDDQEKEQIESQETENEIEDFLKSYKKVESEQILESSILPQPETIEPEKKKRGRKSKVDLGGQNDTIISGSVVSSGLIFTVLDIALPSLALFAYYKLKKDAKKIDLEKIRLKKTQINELTPLLDQVLKETNFTAKPFPVLLIAMFSMYSLNFYEALNE